MSSLSQKLTMFQDDIKKEQNQEALDLLDSMPLSRLKALPIEFGKAKVGQSFEEAFQDQAWTKWFVKTYENSTKMEHRQFLRYVALKVEENPKVKMSQPVKKTPPYLSSSAQGSEQATIWLDQ